MKNLISRLTTTLMGYLDVWLSDPEIEDLITDIRQDMLDCIAVYLNPLVTPPPIWNKVFFASSLQTLWYTRTDLMAFLSEHSGERLARDKLAVITERFRSALPDDQMPRPRPVRH
mgnify:CR=1 FL=1